MKHLEKLTRKNLGEALVDEGLISQSQLDDAEAERQRTGDPLGPILVEAGYISDWDLAKTVATQYQLPFVEMSNLVIGSDVEDLFDPAEQAQHRILPIDRLGGVITLAVSDMPDIDFLRGARERTGSTLFLFVAKLSEIQSRLVDGGAAEPVAESFSEPLTSTPQMELLPPEPEPDIAPSLSIFDEDSGGESEDGEVPSFEVGDGWQNIFDSADESVMKELDAD